MKYRVQSRCVTVSGPPRAICSLKIGTTLPADPSTFPNRTAVTFVREVRARSRTTSSATRFVAPITEEGFTALSVEMRTKRFAPHASAARATWSVPNTLFFTASSGASSISGTCLWAAAWNTYSGRWRWHSRAMRAGSRRSATSARTSTSGCSSARRRARR